MFTKILRLQVTMEDIVLVQEIQFQKYVKLENYVAMIEAVKEINSNL